MFTSSGNEMASGNQDASKENLAGDDDLEELLDSAINDFENPSEVEKSNVSAPATDEGSSEAGASQPWDAEFLQEAQKQFEENMKLLLGSGDGSSPLNPEEFGSHIQKLAEEANKVLSEQTLDPEFSATIAQSLRSLSEDAGNIQSQLDPEALSSMLGDLNLGGGGGGGEGANDLIPFMQTMMQSFLSKDLLYPSLKDICSKYPTWLEEHKDSISASELDNYSKQHKIMEDVCKEFEAETQSDSDDTKKARFVRVLGLMEEMQKLGQPPKDLVGDNSTLLDNSGMPSDPSQCCLM